MGRAHSETARNTDKNKEKDVKKKGQARINAKGKRTRGEVSY